MSRTNIVTLETATPWIAEARRAGTLVPFLGAGMSMPNCKGWKAFIQDLCNEFNYAELAATLAAPEGVPAERLYQVADRVASRLRLLPPGERQALLVKALRQEPAKAPPQLEALTKVDWPLIITTNYDDLIVGAIRDRLGCDHPGHDARLPEERGRSERDCADVVRSLDGLHVPIVWHLQGFITGIATPEPGLMPPGWEALLEQVVLGHQQYQQAINAAPGFRRAFAEVFRRRSLLFLGSGLSESYMINLISEAMFSFGPGPHPHYVLLTENEAQRIDAEFLRVRLGITPVVYGAQHASLPGALKSILHRPAAEETPPTALTSLTFGVKRGTAAVEVCLRFGSLPQDMAENGCIILSAGLDRDTAGQFTRIALGPQAKSFLKGRYAGVTAADFTPAGPSTSLPHRIFRLVRDGKKQPVYLASATVAAGETTDVRDLRTITEATRLALEAVADEHAGATLGLIGAGKRRPFDTSYCLLALLGGIRRFLESPRPDSKLARITVCVRDAQAWAPLAQGRMPAADLLSAGQARVIVRIIDRADQHEEFAISVPHDTTIRTVIDRYGLDAGRLAVTAFPFTARNARNADSGLLDTSVFPGMQIELRPRGVSQGADAGGA